MFHALYDMVKRAVKNAQRTSIQDLEELKVQSAQTSCKPTPKGNSKAGNNPSQDFDSQDSEKIG